MKNLTKLRPATTTGGRVQTPASAGVVLEQPTVMVTAAETETVSEIHIPIVTAEDTPPVIPAAVAETGNPVDEFVEIPVTAEAVTVTMAPEAKVADPIQDLFPGLLTATQSPVVTPANEPGLGDAFRIAGGVTRRAFGKLARKMAPGAKTAGKVAVAGVGVGALAAAGAFVGPAIAAPAALAWAGTALVLGARNMAKHG